MQNSPSYSGCQEKTECDAFCGRRDNLCIFMRKGTWVADNRRAELSLLPWQLPIPELHKQQTKSQTACSCTVARKGKPAVHLPACWSVTSVFWTHIAVHCNDLKFKFYMWLMHNRTSVQPGKSAGRKLTLCWILKEKHRRIFPPTNDNILQNVFTGLLCFGPLQK